MGPFRLRVCEEAVPVDVARLPKPEQAQILNGLSYNPATHALYRIDVTAQSFVGRSRIHRVRRSVQKVDTVLIQVSRASPGVSFLAIQPTTQGSAANPAPVEGEVIFEIGVGPARIKLSGRVKDLFRRSTPAVVAGKTSDFAQWVFGSQSIRQTGINFPLQIFCAVDRKVAAKSALVVCDAECLDGKRLIASARRREVKLEV